MSEKYENFFKKAKEIQEKMELKKLRGLNDFNIFTTLLSAYDEVRVHSKFIHALLDIKGEHYQKELFLELFIKSCGLEDFELDVKNTVTTKEDDYIDLYLTDGKKHIIIENKIYASDQEHQIKNYIEKVVNKNSEITGEDICVIYLTLEKERNVPYNNSLENFALKDGFLKYQNGGKLAELGAIRYESIHYNKEIMDWLNVCLYEVSNLTNLQVLITQYKNTIELLYGNYKGVEMELEELVEENFEIAKEIYEKFNTIRNKLIAEFFILIVKKLKHDGWHIEEKDNIIYMREEKRIQMQDKCYLYYKFKLFDIKNFYASIVLNNSTKNINAKTIKNKVMETKKDLKWHKQGNIEEFDWWWIYGSKNNDFVLDFINKSEAEKEMLADKITDNLNDFINNSKKLISEINDNFNEYI